MNTTHSEQYAIERRCCRLPAAWAALILLDLCLICLVVPSQTSAVAQTDGAPDSWRVVQVDRPADADIDLPRFEALNVLVDSRDKPLAAWQLELICDTPGVEIVGIEGGEHPAFQQPPYYDPKAIQQQRVVLASFDVGDVLPTGRTRVARVHVQVTGAGMCEYRVRLNASATVDGERIPADILVEKAEQ